MAMNAMQPMTIPAMAPPPNPVLGAVNSTKPVAPYDKEISE